MARRAILSRFYTTWMDVVVRFGPAVEFFGVEGTWKAG